MGADLDQVFQFLVEDDRTDWCDKVDGMNLKAVHTLGHISVDMYEEFHPTMFKHDHEKLTHNPNVCHCVPGEFAFGTLAPIPPIHCDSARHGVQFCRAHVDMMVCVESVVPSHRSW